MLDAVFKAGLREFTLYARSERSEYHFWDIPTTINTMEEAIKRRVKKARPSPASDDWRRIETQEINRFEVELARLIYQNDNTEVFKSRIEILRFSTTRTHDSLMWLHPYWRIKPQ